jgi:dienelactone hydrolase
VLTEFLDYLDGDLLCEGYVAYDETETGARRPCVLVCHAWGGQGDAERATAEELARKGYVGFAIDMYGRGIRGDPVTGNEHLMQPFLDDRAMLRREHPAVDPDRLGAIGYCFGGLVALDLARSAPDGLRGVASFHGVLSPPDIGVQRPIAASVLVLHGWEDPIAPPEAVLALARELTDAGADWPMHAFTFPGADLPERGIQYHAAAAGRSWRAMVNFFEEVFTQGGAP